MSKLFYLGTELSIKHPEIAKEWDYNKNSPLTPDDVTCGSDKKVWWKCEKYGHEWQASISHRVQGTGCPVCAGKKVKVGFNDLATTNPETAKEWNYEKNNGLTPQDVTKGSNKKVWWKCSVCGYEYEMTIPNKIAGNKCHLCSGKVVRAGFNDLLSQNPKLAEEWNYNKNEKAPEETYFKSYKKVWWKCKTCGYEWYAVISSRNAGRGCQVCAGRKVKVGYNDLATTNPEIAKEWNYEKNNGLTPQDVTKGSNKKVWWKCLICGDEWEAFIVNRKHEVGCPKCRKKKGAQKVASRASKTNNFLENYPEIAKQWHPTKNGDLTPDMFASKSNQKVWWKCEVCGNEWKVSVNHRTRGQGHGCPVCVGRKVKVGYNDLATTNPEIAKEWNYEKNNGLTPQDVTKGSNKKVWWKCSFCGNEWQAIVSNRTTGKGCANCSLKSSSLAEQSIFYYIKKVFSDAISRDKSFGLEFDIYIPQKRTAIEYDGLFYHQSESALIKDNKKDEFCYKNQITLIRIRDPKLSDTKYAIRINCIDYKVKDLEKAIKEIFKYLEVKNQPKINLNEDRIKIISQFRKSIVENSIATQYPELLKEWDYEKNKNINPETITTGSSVKFWWKCNVCGYEWQAATSDRTRGNGCAVCANRQVKVGYNDLATTNPEIAKEWNYKRNGNLTPQEVVCGSNKKVWWICKTCKHEWQALISSRNAGRGCPKCRYVKSSISKVEHHAEKNNFLENYPEIAKQWHPTKNGNLTPDMVASKSNKKVWWLCEVCGNEWHATPSTRTSGCGCAVCAGKKVKVGFNDLATTNPEIAKEWDYSKNNGLTPQEVTRGSHKRVWWKCNTCGKEWAVSPHNRLKTGCPVCGKKKGEESRIKNYAKRNNLLSNFPNVSSEWNYEKNGDKKPEDYACKSNKKVWWKCSFCGKEWESVIYSRTANGDVCGCATCKKKKHK